MIRAVWEGDLQGSFELSSSECCRSAQSSELVGPQVPGLVDAGIPAAARGLKAWNGAEFAAIAPAAPWCPPRRLGA